MRGCFLIVLFVAALSDVPAGFASPLQESIELDAATTETATFQVRKMACHGCAERLTDGLKKKAGVTEVTTDLKTKLVSVRYVSGKIDEAAVKAAIEKLGFDATPIKKAAPAKPAGT